MSKFHQPIEAGRAFFASALRLSAKALAAAGLLSLAFLAPSVRAATMTNVKYIDADGTEQTCPSATVVEASNARVTWTAGWYVVTNEVTVTGGADCSGAVHLILADAGALTISGVDTEYAGIGVSGAGNSLAVYGQSAGTGVLTVTGGDYAAGIGGDVVGSGSNITINGGEVMVSSYMGAGIGGGYGSSGSNITINGGEVMASSYIAAGIGGGLNGSGSYITINGGTVTATGGTASAGIGSGECGSPSSNIFAADCVIVKAGSSPNPTDEIVHLGTQDIASNLAGKRYVTTEAALPPEPIPSSVTAPEHATAAVYTNGVLSADGIVPSNGVATVVYTANEGYMFKFGQTTITQTLDTTVNPAVAKGVSPGDVIVQWADEREISIDTRARIVVGDLREVLSIAYSTNNWGSASGTDSVVIRVIKPEAMDGTVLVDYEKNNGYVDAQSVFNAYGAYAFSHIPCESKMFDMGDILTSTVYYSQPYALRVTEPAEGGTITAMANTADVEAGTVLGYDFVDIVAEPTDAKWALKTWIVTTNGVAAQDILTKDAAALTNRFEMPCYETVVTGAFVIAEAYRGELAQAATNDYVASTNDLESLRLNRLSDAETDAALAAAKGAFDTAAGALADATKPSEAEAATNALAIALAEIEDKAANLSKKKPYEFVIASDFSANPPFEDYDPDTGTFTWNGKIWTVGVDAFTSFTDAFTNETYGAFATNLHVFGAQTIASEPPMVDTWNLDLIAYEDDEGNEVAAVVSVGTTGNYPNAVLVNITNNLGQITGEGDIILGTTSDNVDPSIYADFLADGADINMTNSGAEQKKELEGNVTVQVDDSSKAESDPATGVAGVILPGVENPDGDVYLKISENVPSDVLVAGSVKTPHDVWICNESTSELEIAGAVEAVKVKIDNCGKTSDAEGAIIAKKIIASGDVTIDNAAHLEANVEAGGTITIHNGSPNTIVGMYDGADISISGGKEGAISNVTFISDGPVAMKDVIILTGPFAIDAPAGAITNKGTLAWNICGGNFTAKLADFDAVTFLDDSRFQIWVDLEQSVGRYVLADNAGSLADKDAFKVEVREGADTFTVSLGEGYVVSAGSKRLYRLDLDEADALVLTVIDTATHFDQTAYSVLEGGALKVRIHGGSMLNAVQATLSYVKNTGAYSAAYLDGKKVSFPLRLNWAKGEIGVKEILFQTAADADSKYDRTFTLQLSAPVSEDVVPGYDVCTVTLTDAQGKSAQYKYVRALAYPANAGTVTGAGTLTSKTKSRTLKATSKGIGTFKGWYAAKADDPNVPDLTKRLTTKTSYKTKTAGTYFAYYVNVKAVPTINEPTGSSGFATKIDSRMQTIEGQVGVGFRLLCSSVGAAIKVSGLPSGLKWDAEQKRIAGIPKKTGTYTVTLKAANAAGAHVMTYKVVIKAMPSQAIGTWYGVVRDVDGRPGVGSVKLTVGSTGKISVKVLTVGGTRTFSGNGYNRSGDTAFKRSLTTAKGEKFAFTLDLTGDWATRQVTGTISGGAFEKEGSAGSFGLVRNPYDAKTGSAEARQLLAAYVGTYARGMYLDTTKKGSASFQVKSNGNVLAKATVGSKTFSGTLPGGVKVWNDGSGTIEGALGLKNAIWSAEVGLDSSERTLEGAARYLTRDGTDWNLAFGLPDPD